MIEKTKLSIPNLMLYGLAVLLCAYIIARGILVSVTVDEVCTYDRYVKFGFWEIYAFQTPSTDMLPNNHLLNSWLAHISVALFGIKTWSLRLPNLLFACIAVFYSTKLVRAATENESLRLLGIGFLFFNQYFLDFFSLARGYGMMHSCIIISLYFLFVFLKEKKYAFLIGTLSAGFLAVLSIFGALNYLLSLGFILIFVSLLDKTAFSNRQRIVNISTTIVFLTANIAIIYRPLIIILKSNQIFGGTDGFWKDTVGSLVQQYSIMGLPGIFTRIGIALLCCLIVSQLFFIFKNTPIRNWVQEPLCAFSLILSMTLVAPILQHSIGNSPFLVARTALLYIPLWGVCVWFAWLSWAARDYKLIPNTTLNYAFFLILLGSWVKTVNFQGTREWQFDAFTKIALNDMIKDKKSRHIDAPVRIGVRQFCQPSFAFHINFDSKVYNNEFIAPSYETEVLPNKNYAYYFVYDDSKHPAQILQNNYTIIQDYGKGYQLFRKK
jgi:hypothetical protein